MAFKKGNSGRPKGAKNKSSKEKIEAQNAFNGAGGFDRVFKLIEAVAKDSPKDAADLMLKAAKFFMPTLKAVEVKADVDIEVKGISPIEWLPPTE